MSIPHSPDPPGFAAFAWVPVVLACCSAWVFAADDHAAERARIERERIDVEARARVAERNCAERFVVAPCLKQVRGERRSALRQLKHQGAVLDDALRKRRAAERQARIEQRHEAQAREDEQRVAPAAAASKRAPRAANAAPADDASSSAAAPRRALGTATSAAEAARRAHAAKQRAHDAAAHRAAVEQRNRERAAQRPPQPSLPVPDLPPAPAASVPSR